MSAGVAGVAGEGGGADPPARGPGGVPRHAGRRHRLASAGRPAAAATHRQHPPGQAGPSGQSVGEWGGGGVV